MVVAAAVVACSSPAAVSGPDTPLPGQSSPSSYPASPMAPTASAGPSGTAASFESARYGYRLAVPADWSLSETPGAGGTHPDEPGVDTFKDRTGHILSVVGEGAATLAGWTCAINRHLQGDEHRLTVENSEAIDLDGIPGRVSEYHLEIRPYVIHYLTVETVREGLGLTLSLESTTKRDVEDRQILDDLLGSFSWT